MEFYYAEKANRVLRIPPHKADEYFSLDYDIKDENGKMVKEHRKPSDEIEQLKKENAKLKKEIKALKAKGEEKK